MIDRKLELHFIFHSDHNGYIKMLKYILKKGQIKGGRKKERRIKCQTNDNAGISSGERSNNVFIT